MSGDEFLYSLKPYRKRDVRRNGDVETSFTKIHIRGKFNFILYINKNVKTHLHSYPLILNSSSYKG